MKFFRIIMAYFCIGIGCILIILLYYPLHLILRWRRPSIKGFIIWLKRMLIEVEPPSEEWKYCKYSKLSLASMEKIRERARYFRLCKNIESEPTPIVSINKKNHQKILPLLKIPNSEKEKIVNIIERGNEVVVCELAYTPAWGKEEKFVVIEPFDKKPPKVKYMHKRIRNRYSPGFNLKQEINLIAYYWKYNSMKKPLLYPVVEVDKENGKELLPVLDIPEETKKDIAQLVNNNKIVIITEAAFQPEWKWEEKYLVFDGKK